MKIVNYYTEYPESPELGDMVIVKQHMPGFGPVYEARKYERCLGMYAKPGDCDWFSQTNEPFGSIQEAQNFIHDME